MKVFIATFIAFFCLAGHADGEKCPKWLRSANVYKNWVDLTDEQNDYIKRNRTSYVNLAEVRDERLRESLVAAREKVKRNLGYLPRIHREHWTFRQETPVEVRLFPPRVRAVPGNQMAISVFKFPENKNRTMISNNVKVAENVRGNGLSELMLLEMLAEVPWIRTIKVEELQKTNLEVFTEAYRTTSCKDAIRETPAYKKFKFIGFSEIDDAECVKGWDAITGEKMWGVSFTVERPE